MNDELYRYTYVDEPWSMNYVVYRHFTDHSQAVLCQTSSLASFVYENDAADFCAMRNCRQGESPAAPKIKPLVWRVETWTHGIASAFGLEIEIRRDKLSHHKIGWQLNWVDGGRVIRASYASVDEAKAAAQAWYEAKIRECLE